jgi:hypothetical protein
MLWVLVGIGVVVTAWVFVAKAKVALDDRGTLH